MSEQPDRRTDGRTPACLTSEQLIIVYWNGNQDFGKWDSSFICIILIFAFSSPSFAFFSRRGGVRRVCPLPMYHLVLIQLQGDGGLPGAGAPRAAHWVPPVSRQQRAFVTNSEQVAPELHPDEGVQQWIDGAVHEGQHPGDVEGHLHPVPGLTRPHLHEVAIYEQLDEQDHVVRQPAHDEGEHHRQDDPYGLLLMVIVRFAQCHQGRAVADSHDPQWQEEAQHVARDVHDDVQQVAGFVHQFFVADVAAQVLCFHLPLLDYSGDGQHHSHQPHRGARYFHHQPTGRLDLCRFHNGEVTVHADARQHEDAAVLQRLMETRQNFAQAVAEDPSVVDVDGPERQGEAEEELRQRQVGQVDVGAAVPLHHAAHHADDQAVAHRAEAKHQHVGEHQAQIIESRHSRVARGRRVIVQIKRVVVLVLEVHLER